MTNTTDKYWSADGVSLQTFARNISTLGGSRRGVPNLRGEDITIPYMPGQIWQPKTADSRTLSLAMWVRGTDDDGNYLDSSGDQFDANWEQLQQLLWTEGRQIKLTKRVKVNGALRSVSAMAEFAGGLEPTMIGRNAARTTVDLKLADPYFYDDTIVTYTLVNGDNTIRVLGTAPTLYINAKVAGPRNTPQVRVKSPAIAASQVQYNAALSTGDTLSMSVRQFQAVTKPNGIAAFDSSGLVTHSGLPQWLKLMPGDNVVNVASTSGTGLVQLDVRGAFL